MKTHIAICHRSAFVDALLAPCLIGIGLSLGCSGGIEGGSDDTEPSLEAPWQPNFTAPYGPGPVAPTPPITNGTVTEGPRPLPPMQSQQTSSPPPQPRQELPQTALVEGSYNIRAAGSGRFLAVEGGSTAAKAGIILWDFHGGPDQEWELLPSPAGYFVRAGTGQFLDVQWGSAEPGTPVWTWEFNGGLAQQWRPIVAEGGAYLLQNGLGTFLDVQWGGTENGTPVWTWVMNGDDAQLWHLELIEPRDVSIEALTAQSGSAWPSVGPETPIRVCWENPTVSNSGDRATVQSALSVTWDAASGVLFQFETIACPVGFFDGIRIAIADEWPHAKALGHHLRGVKAGIVLNFSFVSWCPECAVDRTNRIRSIAIHEFGHALGFAHEHNRADCSFPCVGAQCDTPCTGAGCTGLCLDEPQGVDGDVVLTNCDNQSIMNYCFDNAFNGALSAFDIDGVRAVYGSGPSLPGFREIRTFRVLDVPTHCPVGAMRGDLEFSGAPNIASTVQLDVSPDGQHILATSTLLAATPLDDQSSTRGIWSDVVWRVEPGKRIVRILSPNFSEVTFRGDAAGAEFIVCNDGPVMSRAPEVPGVARLFHIIGDTGAGDISADTDCRCDTQLRGVELNAVTVEVAAL